MNIEELEQLVLDMDGRFKMLDQYVRGEKALMFQCGASGLLYPADYIKEWGVLYGVGLGPDPVSESLQSDYDIPPPPLKSTTRRLEDIMHPVRASKSQIDLVPVHPGEVKARSAVVAKADRGMFRRSQIIYEKQVANPKSRLPAIRALWAKGNI